MRQFLVSCLLLFAFAQAPSEAPDEGRVRVEVVNSSNHRLIAGAKVFVLGETGTELAAGTTDDHGVAILRVPVARERPKYILVEHPAFFLSGMRWQAGLQEYYILVTILTVR
jgi:hypothetical protein